MTQLLLPRRGQSEKHLVLRSAEALTPRGPDREGRKGIGVSSTDPSTATKGTGPSDLHPLPAPFLTPQMHGPKQWLDVGVRARVGRSEPASTAAPSQPLEESSVCAIIVRFKTSSSPQPLLAHTEGVTQPCPQGARSDGTILPSPLC